MGCLTTPQTIDAKVVNNLKEILSKIISKEDNGLALVGKILMIVGAIISTILYGIFLGWIFFIAGIIFIWFSELPKKVKWLWSIIPIVIWIPLTILFFIIIPLLYHSIVIA